MDRIKVILADDHRLVRDGIKSLLNKSNDILVIGEAENGAQLISLLDDLQPDVILIDITMPGMSGIATIEKAKADRPWVKFIVLTMHEEPEYIVESVRKGASGYLLKNVEAEELLQAIKTVAAGGKYFNAAVSGIMIDSFAKPAVVVPDAPELTEREMEVLKAVASGLSTKLIADKLGIGTRTVETHRAHIMEKLQAVNTAELIKKAFELKLIQ